MPPDFSFRTSRGHLPDFTMLFVTNRHPKQSLRSRRNRNWEFDPRDNSVSDNVYFCERHEDGSCVELLHGPFFDRLGTPSDDSPVLLFIHGFNTPYEQAFVAARELQEIAAASRPESLEVIPLIWPSFAAESGLQINSAYTSDRARSQQSAPAYAKALRMFLDWQTSSDRPAEERCRRPIHILTQSMGARLLRDSLHLMQNEYMRRGIPALFRNIFLAAPDVVNETLERGHEGQAIVDSAARTLVYYAFDDLALRGSKIANLDEHVSRRLGHTGPENMAVERVTRRVFALDCSSFNQAWDPAFGHGYYRLGKAGPAKGSPSPLFLHALATMDSRHVPLVDSERMGEIPRGFSL